MQFTYAVLSERSIDQDRTETLLSAHVKEENRAEMARNREDLDQWLLSPMGKLADAEAKMVKELGGAA